MHDLLHDTVRQLLEIRRYTHGPTRVAATERLAAQIETQGPPESLPQALLDLVEAHAFADTADQAFVTYQRLLRLWDDQPTLFDEEDARDLFWEFPWVADSLAQYPTIAVDTVEAFFDDMERRHRIAGRGLGPVASARFRWRWHAGLPDAEEARLAWRASADPDACEACTLGRQVDYLVEVGDDAAAVALGLTQTGECDVEPARSLFALALAQQRLGDADGAARSHAAARLALLDDAQDAAASLGQEFELLARGGSLGLALALLRDEHPSLLLHARTPLLRLRFLIGVLAGLAANRERAGEATGLTMTDAPSVAELMGWVEAEARTLASAFDARSGAGFYTGLITRALGATRADAAGPVGSPVGDAPATEADAPSTEADAPDTAGAEPTASDKGVDAPATEADAPDTAGAEPTASDKGVDAPATEADAPATEADAPATAGAEPTASDKGVAGAPTGQYERAERLATAGRHSEAAAAYEAAAFVARRDGLAMDEGAALAEAAHQAELAGDTPGAHRLFGASVARLEDSAATPALLVPTLVGWAPVASDMGDEDGVLRGLERVVAELDAVAPSALGEGRRREVGELRASALEAVARTIASLRGAARGQGRELSDAAGAAATAAEGYVHLGRIPDAARAFWLAGRIQREAGDVEAAVWSLESALEGFAVSGRGAERVQVARQLVDVLREHGRHDHADLIASGLVGPG